MEQHRHDEANKEFVEQHLNCNHMEHAEGSFVNGLHEARQVISDYPWPRLDLLSYPRPVSSLPSTPIYRTQNVRMRMADFHGWR